MADQTTRIETAKLLHDRVLVATHATLPADFAEILGAHADISGVISAGGAAAAQCLNFGKVVPDVVLGHDAEAAPGYWASADHPFQLPPDEGLFGQVTLAEQVQGTDERLDVVLSPSGVIRTGDRATLESVVEHCNAVTDPRLLCALPVEACWFTDEHREHLIGAIRASSHLAILSAVGFADPFQNPRVTDGLVALTECCGARLVLHRTDMTAVQYLARGGCAAVVGTTTTLRHSAPRSRKRRKGFKRGGAVFIAGIDEFRDVELVRSWFGDSAPRCADPHCCGRLLTDFDPYDADDMAVLMAHNVRGVLGVVSELLAADNRRQWLAVYRDRIRTAYDELRAKTKIRDVSAYAGADVWLNMTD